MDGLNDTKKYLFLQFQMKDLNEVDQSWVLKLINLVGILLNVNLITKKVKNKFNHIDIREANIPYDVACKLFGNSGRTISQVEYASAVGSLLHGMHTRPDIAFTESIVNIY